MESEGLPGLLGREWPGLASASCWCQRRAPTRGSRRHSLLSKRLVFKQKGETEDVAGGEHPGGHQLRPPQDPVVDHPKTHFLAQSKVRPHCRLLH